MKFIHIADLHLGKQMNDLSLMDDQRFILDQIAHIAAEEQADAVLIAGDVYQRSTPQAEAMALFDAFVSRLARDGRKVFVISGNHDSALRISYFSSLVRNAGVYVTEAFTGEMQHVTLQDADGELTVWMLPFLRPAQVRRALPEEKVTSYQDAVAAVLRNADIDLTGRNLLMCHQFIIGCEVCDSEELSVGTLDHIDGAVFDGFDYVALGHIHKPQRMNDHVRYSGSPMTYSFGAEEKHQKGFVLFDTESGEQRFVPIRQLHPHCTVTATYDEIRSRQKELENCWLNLTVEDRPAGPELYSEMRERFPLLAFLRGRSIQTGEITDAITGEAFMKMNDTDILKHFLGDTENALTPTDEQLAWFEQCMLAQEKEDLQ